MKNGRWSHRCFPNCVPARSCVGGHLANTRAVLNGVLWVMYSGASWSTLPRKYPSYQTCHRRFKTWHDSGVLARVMLQLFGPAGESLYSLMTSRMRVPGSVPETVESEQAQVHEILPVNPELVPRRYMPGVIRRAA